MNYISRIIATLFLACLFTAASADIRTQVKVTLEVPSGSSAEEVYASLEQAAAKVCRTQPVYAHGRLARERACRSEFMADALLKIDRKALTALHQARTGEGAEGWAKIAR